MARKPPEVEVNPDVLKWARESAGWSPDETSRKLKVHAERLHRWESGAERPPLNALVALAQCFKRPLAALLLPEPPVESTPPRDFRSLPGRREQLSPETLLVIRRARRLQSAAMELMSQMGRSSSPKIGIGGLEDRPDRIAAAERAALAVSLDEQTRWKDPYEASRAWRERLEHANVLVFQFAMPIEDCRGFSLAENQPPVIVVNPSDAIRARIFTLFHEYAHLLLRRPGLCLPELKKARKQDQVANVEDWCNRFAGALLAPEDAFRTRRVGPLRDFLVEQSSRLKVSKQVVLRRMLDLGMIGRKQFFEALETIQAEEKQTRRAGGPVRPARRTVSERGRLFASLVLQGLERGLITHADVADYLSLRLKHLGEMQTLLAA